MEQEILAFGKRRPQESNPTQGTTQSLKSIPMIVPELIVPPLKNTLSQKPVIAIQLPVKTLFVFRGIKIDRAIFFKAQKSSRKVSVHPLGQRGFRFVTQSRVSQHLMNKPQVRILQRLVTCRGVNGDAEIRFIEKLFACPDQI